MSFEVGVVGQFTASHHLVGDFGPASLPHAHAYRVEVSVTGDTLRGDGTLFDLTVLQQAVEVVARDLDGSSLNDRSDLNMAPNPTAEVVARFVFERVAAAVSELGLERLEVRIWESPVAYASYRGALA